MKRSALALCLLCLPVGGFAVSAGSTAATTDERVEQLEAELRDIRARLDQTILVLHRQAAGARSLAKALDLSEQEGFTYGINPRSREVLLDGFHAYLSRLQSDLPSKKAKPRPSSRARIH